MSRDDIVVCPSEAELLVSEHRDSVKAAALGRTVRCIYAPPTSAQCNLP